MPGARLQTVANASAKIRHADGTFTDYADELTIDFEEFSLLSNGTQQKATADTLQSEILQTIRVGGALIRKNEDGGMELYFLHQVFDLKVRVSPLFTAKGMPKEPPPGAPAPGANGPAQARGGAPLPFKR